MLDCNFMGAAILAVKTWHNLYLKLLTGAKKTVNMVVEHA